MECFLLHRVFIASAVKHTGKKLKQESLIAHNVVTLRRGACRDYKWAQRESVCACVCVWVYSLLFSPYLHSGKLFIFKIPCLSRIVHLQAATTPFAFTKEKLDYSFTQRNIDQYVYYKSTSVCGLRLLTKKYQQSHLLISISRLCTKTCRPNSSHRHGWSLPIPWKRWLTYEGDNIYSFLLPIKH